MEPDPSPQDDQRREFFKRLVARYIILLAMYFLFLKVFFTLFDMDVSNWLILGLSLVLFIVQPIRDYMVHRRFQALQRERNLYPFGLPNKTSLNEREFQELISPVRGKKPWVTYILLAANVVVFIMVTIAGGSTNTEVLVQYGAKIEPLIVSGGEWWRIVTANFLHAGFAHLAMNMTLLFLFGSMVEKLYGSLNYWLIYGFSGLGGLGMSLYMLPYPGVGASGAIFGIIGAILVLGFRYRHQIPNQHRDLYTWVLLFYIFLDMTISVLVPMIDFYAHLGGLIFGAVTAFLLDIHPQVTGQMGLKSEPQKFPRLQRGLVYVTSLVLFFTVLFSFFQAGKNVFAPSPFYGETRLATYKDDLMGIEIPVPEKWKFAEQVPGLCAWSSPLGHQLRLLVDIARTRNPEREFHRYKLIHQLPNMPSTSRPLPQLELPLSIHHAAAYEFHTPYTTSLGRPTSSVIAVMIHGRNVYILQLISFQPHRTIPLFEKILKGVKFFPPAGGEEIYQAYKQRINESEGLRKMNLLNIAALRLAGEGIHLKKAREYAQEALKIYDEYVAKAESDPWTNFLKEVGLVGKSMGMDFRTSTMDTLAEVEYRAGNYRRAVQIMQTCLERAPKVPYLEHQLERFKTGYTRALGD